MVRASYGSFYGAKEDEGGSPSRDEHVSIN